MLPLIILAGPTTSRKSDTAIVLAEKLDLEIVNADSMQVYKYFDIGTAKPARECVQKIPHHLIDVLEPDEEFNAFQFKVRALKHIEEIRGRNKIPLLVGGTGLYLKVLMENFNCAVSITEEIRLKVQSQIQSDGLAQTYAKLQTIDPEAAQKIAPNDPVRIERALAVYMQTGRAFSDFEKEETSAKHDFPIQSFYLEWEREALYRNINQRVDRMIDQGLVAEVKQLLERGFSPSLKPFQSIGYSQVVRHLTEELPLEQAIDEIKRDTRRYAKRQITWFKKMNFQQRIAVTPEKPITEIAENILSHLPKIAALLILFILFFANAEPSLAKDLSPLKDGIRWLHSGDYSKARNRFRALQNKNAESIQGKRARYLLGLAYMKLQKPGKAIEHLEAARSLNPDIEDYIRFDLAQAYFDDGKTELALKEIDTLLMRTPRTLTYAKAELLRFEARRKLSQVQQALDGLQLAIEKIFHSRSKKHFVPQLPEMFFKLAELQQESGNFKEAYGNYRMLNVRYPTEDVTKKAALAMKELEEKQNILRDPWTPDELKKRTRGLLAKVRYEKVIEEILNLKISQSKLSAKFYFYLARAYKGTRQRTQSIQTLQEFLLTYPNHPREQEARYLIGRNLWNLDKDKSAIEYFQQSIKKNSRSEWAIKARYLLGRINESSKKFPAALKHYTILIKKYSQHEYAQQAAWKIGWIYYLQGDYKKSADRFQRNASLYPDGLFIENNLFWQAKSEEKSGEYDAAQSLYQETTNRYPFTYYGLRSRNLINTSAPQENDAEQPRPTRVSFVPKDNAAPMLDRPLTSKEKFHYARALELTAMEFWQEAGLELQQLGKTIRKNREGILWLSNLYIQAQSFSDAVKLLQLYKDFKTKKNAKDLSKVFWKLFYPTVYLDLIAEHSKIHGLDPWFVKGLIRQESLFNAESLSFAGARGLMQIMPETGKKVYATFQKSQAFDVDVLFNPKTNIELGMKYLWQLHQRFGDNKTHILISYNAGPHVLQSWLKRFSTVKDPDEFIEHIPYPETQKYVKRVMRNHGIYKMLSKE